MSGAASQPTNPARRTAGRAARDRASPGPHRICRNLARHEQQAATFRRLRLGNRKRVSCDDPETIDACVLAVRYNAHVCERRNNKVAREKEAASPCSSGTCSSNSAPMGVVRLRHELREPSAAPVWPAGVHPIEFVATAAAEVHELLSLGYGTGGGAVGAFEQWWNSVSTDAEFDAALCFLARNREGPLVGVALCWTSGFIKDLVVHPDWRRHGVGEALLRHVLATFRRRGALAVELKVHADNVSALRLYKRLGMHPV
jgi:ribosomal protein S18 acetylase RimI-like enzyme